MGVIMYKMGERDGEYKKRQVIQKVSPFPLYVFPYCITWPGCQRIQRIYNAGIQVIQPVNQVSRYDLMQSEPWSTDLLATTGTEPVFNLFPQWRQVRPAGRTGSCLIRLPVRKGRPFSTFFLLVKSIENRMDNNIWLCKTFVIRSNNGLCLSCIIYKALSWHGYCLMCTMLRHLPAARNDWKNGLPWRVFNCRKRTDAFLQHTNILLWNKEGL